MVNLNHTNFTRRDFDGDHKIPAGIAREGLLSLST
jgi:hypothetical protein